MELKYSIATTFLLCLLLLSHLTIFQEWDRMRQIQKFMELIIEDQRLTLQSCLLQLVTLVIGLGFIKILSRHLINPKVLEAMTEENKLMKSMDE